MYVFVKRSAQYAERLIHWVTFFCGRGTTTHTSVRYGWMPSSYFFLYSISCMYCMRATSRWRHLDHRPTFAIQTYHKKLRQFSCLYFFIDIRTRHSVDKYTFINKKKTTAIITKTTTTVALIYEKETATKQGRIFWQLFWSYFYFCCCCIIFLFRQINQQQ